MNQRPLAAVSFLASACGNGGVNDTGNDSDYGDEEGQMNCHCNGLTGNEESLWYCNGQCRCGACDDHVPYCFICGQELEPGTTDEEAQAEHERRAATDE